VVNLLFNGDRGRPTYEVKRICLEIPLWDLSGSVVNLLCNGDRERPTDEVKRICIEIPL
jgi:hypothetical protein